MLLLQAQDGGHLYAETNFDNFIVEPWNAWSSLAIALPAVYWAFKTYKNIGEFKFLWFCIPLLFINGIGSLLFHAFRSSGFLLLMDALPAGILTVGVSIYFWSKIVDRTYLVLIIVGLAIGLRFLVYNYFSLAVSTNLSYLIGGTILFLPALIFLRKDKYRNTTELFISMLSLILSLFFRTIDRYGWFSLTMGTHFLWHVFNGLGGYYLASYLFKVRVREIDLLNKELVEKDIPVK